MRLFILSFFALSFFSTQVCYAQDHKSKALARQYYNSGEYDKAAELYQKLHDKDPANGEYYNFLFRSLLNLKEYDQLEKVIKKQVKKNKGDAKFLIDLGYLYKQNGDKAAMQSNYQKAIDGLGKDAGVYRRIANQFNAYRETDYSIKTYEIALEKVSDPTLFYYDLGNAYIKKTDYEKASLYYLDLIESKANYLQSVKNSVQRADSKEDAMDAMEIELYSRIQKTPNKNLYPELLIWIYTQRKDYESALIQAKALDKRNAENGHRVLDVARIAARAASYSDAIEGYEYLLEKGENNSFYLVAKTEILETRKERLLSGSDYTTQDVEALKTSYLAFIEEYGENQNTAKTIRELALLEAYYLYNIQAAITRLEKLVNLSGLKRNIKNRSKLDLGDFYVIYGDVWEATLLYSQVDKAEKDSPLGEDARFRNARLSYFKGDFEWAQAQLKVLKSATTELIANDALKLSIFIIDNLGLDTTTTAMEMFSRADFLIFQNKNDQALEVLDSLSVKQPNHALKDDILYAEARIYNNKRDYLTAAEKLQEILAFHKDDLIGDNATFMLAELYEYHLDDKEKAMELYKQLMIDFKDSVLVVEARKRFRDLRGDVN